MQASVRAFAALPFAKTAGEPIVPTQPERKSLDVQWRQLASYIDDQNHRAQALTDVQVTAGRHLDAAHYALDRIALELVDVMPSITQVARIEPGNVVHFDQPVPAGLRSAEELEALVA